MWLSRRVEKDSDRPVLTFGLHGKVFAKDNIFPLTERRTFTYVRMKKCSSEIKICRLVSHRNVCYRVRNFCFENKKKSTVTDGVSKENSANSSSKLQFW